jgi:hypothetical protein
MCHASRHRPHHRVTEVRGAEPVVPEPRDLRASDAERERTVDALRSHAAAGRLDAEELEERLGRALAARSRSDLAALLEDVPETRGAPAVARRRRPGKDPRALLAVAVLLVAIWAVSGAGYFWPMWPLLWFAFAGLMHRRAGNPGVIGNTVHTQ